MATANVNQIRTIPGRLIKDPTDLSSAPNFGGTPLGLFRDVEFRFGYRTELITAMEYGGTPVESVYLGETAVLAGLLRSEDADAIGSIFPNSTLGTSSGERTIDGNAFQTGKNRSGYLLSSKAIKLLFAPKDYERDPFIVIYKAIPALEEAAALQLAVTREYGIAVAFHAIPDSTGRLYRIGRREDIAL
jgi:hypothetical protein